jgi:hypothetical protein
LDTISNLCNLIGINTEEVLLKILNIKTKYWIKYINFA